MVYGDEIRKLHRPAKLKLKLEYASDADPVAAAALRLVQRRIGARIPLGTAFARMPTRHPYLFVFAPGKISGALWSHRRRTGGQRYPCPRAGGSSRDISDGRTLQRISHARHSATWELAYGWSGAGGRSWARRTRTRSGPRGDRRTQASHNVWGTRSWLGCCRESGTGRAAGGQPVAARD